MGCFGVWVFPFVMGYWVFVSEFVCKRVTKNARWSFLGYWLFFFFFESLRI